MEKDNILPDYIVEKYVSYIKDISYPNVVRTRNITREGLYTLIEKNELKWSYSNFVQDYDFLEGLIKWGSNHTLVYFKKLENDTTYKIYVLTNNLENIKMLIIGLNKFFTIDKI